MESEPNDMESLLSTHNLGRLGSYVKGPFHMLLAWRRAGRRVEQRDAPVEALGLEVSKVALASSSALRR
jgi:hypothetical protein